MPEAVRLTVTGACETTYPAVVGDGLLHDTLPMFIAARGIKQTAIITNEVVSPLYGEALAGWLPGSFTITLPDGEAYKTLESIQYIYDSLLASGANRDTLVVALGGGVIGDIAGFAAASFMRGMRLVQAPTTLLAMVDASLGGKTGIDLPQGKNLVGAFKDPLAVFADMATLQTLPIAEMRGGLSEVIKAGLIGDPMLLDLLLPDDPVQMIYKSKKWLLDIVQRAMRVKIDIVEQDRLEGGIRAVLNLGHTFAHAIELVSGFEVSHGRAVAVGLVGAARLSARMGLCAKSLPANVEELVSQLWTVDQLLVQAAPEELWDAMQHDKKWRNGVPTFVLLKDVGAPIVVSGVERSDVLSVLESLG